MEYEKVQALLGGAKRFGEKAGLIKPARLSELLGNPQTQLSFVHIAGTNGKGSTAAYLSNVLMRAGYTVGLYTSPFIYEFNERMRVNGENISDDALLFVMEKVRAAAEQMKDEGTGYPTEFDMITAAAFYYFAEMQCDIVVLEVGLGGRFDATNIINTPLVSVITKLGLDHTQYLGDTIGKIAFEKCGIIKEGGVTVTLSSQNTEALAVIQKESEERNNRLILCEKEELSDCKTSGDGNQFSWKGTHYRTSLCGAYQLENAHLALCVLEELKKQGFAISEDAVKQGLYETRWSGRMEKISESPLVVIDGAHNPDGMRAFVRAAKEFSQGGKNVCVVAMMKDKEVLPTLSELSGFTDTVIFTTVENPRAMAPEELIETSKGLFSDCSICDNPKEALKQAVKLADREGTVFVVGSLYLIREIKEKA